jgi:hypothetical protein
MISEETTMDDAFTCGKGLARHSTLPATLGDVMEAGAEVLELHTKALDPADEIARRELDAYLGVARQHRAIARELRALAGELAACDTLPMASHDEQAMADPRAGAAFERFVGREVELITLLEGRIEEDRQLLGMMRRG